MREALDIVSGAFFVYDDLVHLIYYLQNPGEEFRYSLRSAAKNLPVERVTVIGDAPTWLKGAKVLKGNPTPDAHVNSVANVHIASRQFSDEFVVMNDDFYVLKETAAIPHYWYPTLTAHAAQYNDPRSEVWRQLYTNTARYLSQRTGVMPKSFELHVPMRIVGAEMDKILNESAKSPHLQGPGLWRSLYGNLSETVKAEGATRRQDVKAHTVKQFEVLTDYASTDEKTNQKIMPLLQDMFTEKSPWEKK